VKLQKRLKEISIDCFKQNGYYPISFSYPKLHLTPQTKFKSLSSIIPGVPYAYNSYDEYIEEYRSSILGVTHKKAGWDCFRHLEIMYAGSIPNMTDIEQVPEFTMMYYPKELLKVVSQEFQKNQRMPSATIQNQILEHFDEYLTTLRMVQNVLTLIGDQPKSVLFLDDAVVEAPDYLSMLTLVGLKQNFRTKCFTFSEPNYLYDDYSGDTSSLYGRGFGYTRVLEFNLKSIVPRNVRLNSFDLLVVGSLARNLDLAQLVESSTVPAVYLFGEDTPPNQDELGLIHNSRAHTFVREIY